ncbi:MAG: HEAT repeat domain-containing protein [Candidatus Goldbacteria bacterium]|nr:HEAT repeat domain-containing protein [Candidatus Goldiibacteriota bacterium]
MRNLLLILIFITSIYFYFQQKKNKEVEQKKIETLKKEEIKKIEPKLPDYITNEYMLQLSKTTIITLKKLVYDTNENIRFSAIELLWQLKDKDTPKIIKNALDTETETSIKLKIIEMLSKEKSKLSLYLIAHGLKNYDREVKIKACEVMGDFIDKETIELLTPALNDYDDDVKKRAIESVKKVKSAIEQHREQKVKEIFEPKPIFTTHDTISR